MTEPVVEDHVSAIRTLLLDQLRKSPRMLGSKLGLALRQELPQLNLRLEFGGLHRFVIDHCSDVISWLGRHGGDDLFGLPGDSLQPAFSPKESDRPVSMAWDALTRPDFPRTAAVNATTGDLLALGPGEAPPDGYRQVQGLSVEDYRSMARDFLRCVDEGARPRLEAALAQPDFWSLWLEALKDASLWQGWWRWRFFALEKIVKARFSSAGVDHELSDAIWSRLRESRRPSPPALEPGPRVMPALGQGTPRLITTDSTQLRTIAHLAVDLMSDTELRELRVPLGSLADAFQQISKR